MSELEVKTNAPGEIVVATKAGGLRGQEERGTLVFRGIRYAEPPVGPLRFRAPVPVKPWAGVRDALEFAPMCPQITVPAPGKREEQGDDCLALNIWTPAIDEELRPVMLWYHGGGFTNGSGSHPMFNGVNLAKHDVVLVTMNYRLGVLGFMDAEDFGPEYAGSGNCAVLDALAALQWVRDNIAAFGGDPNNITIFGESAGGGLVTSLLATPRANGLFKRAVIQSGAIKDLRTQEVAKRSTRHFCHAAGIPYGDAAALRGLSTERIIEIANANNYSFIGTASEDAENPGPVGFLPTVGDSVIPVGIDTVLNDKTAPSVDLLTGACNDEFKLFFSPMLITKGDPAKLAPIDPIAAKLRMSAEELTEAYRKFHPGMSDFDIRVTIQSDAFILGARELADQYRHINPSTYRYLFDWKSPAFDGVLGAAHGMELPFLFGNFEAQRAWVGDNPPLTTEEAVQTAWVSFARTGNPGWPAWNGPAGEIMVFDTESEVGPDPFQSKVELWKRGLPALAA